MSDVPQDTSGVTGHDDVGRHVLVTAAPAPITEYSPMVTPGPLEGLIQQARRHVAILPESSSDVVRFLHALAPNMEPTVDLEACLPAAVRDRSPTISRVAVGMSGASVYRVDAGGDACVLRLAGTMIDPAAWRRQLAIEHRAADAGLAPRIIHVDEARRAVVSAFVVDRSFPLLLRNPETHEAALDLLARTFRRLHALSIPSDTTEHNSGPLFMYKPGRPETGHVACEKNRKNLTETWRDARTSD
jgi:hypothetical protein